MEIRSLTRYRANQYKKKVLQVIDCGKAKDGFPIPGKSKASGTLQLNIPDNFGPTANSKLLQQHYQVELTLGMEGTLEVEILFLFLLKRQVVSARTRTGFQLPMFYLILLNGLGVLAKNGVIAVPLIVYATIPEQMKNIVPPSIPEIKKDIIPLEQLEIEE